MDIISPDYESVDTKIRKTHFLLLLTNHDIILEYQKIKQDTHPDSTRRWIQENIFLLFSEDRRESLRKRLQD